MEDKNGQNNVPVQNNASRKICLLEDLKKK